MSEEQPAASPVRRYVLLALKISVSLALLVLLFSRIDVGALWATARGASIAWLAAALAMYAVNVLVSAWRWHRLLRTQHIEIGRRSILGSFLVALFFSNFLPSNIGG